MHCLKPYPLLQRPVFLLRQIYSITAYFSIRTFLYAVDWRVGLVVLTIALLLRPGVYLRKLVELDENEDIASSTLPYARRIFMAYVLLTVICIGMIWISCGSLFNAITHAFSDVSTGGFSNFDNSLAGFDSPLVSISVIMGCMFGALPLLLYFLIRHYHFLMIYQNAQVRAITFFTLFTSILLFFVLMHDSHIQITDAVFHALLMAVSAQTTVGFSSIDIMHIGPHGM